MKIRNKTDRDRTLAATGVTVEAGGTTVVTKDLGESLRRQIDVWEVVNTKTESEDS